MLQARSYQVSLELDALMREELPYLRSLCLHDQNLEHSLQALLSFPLEQAVAMPFYELPDSATAPIEAAFSIAYAALLAALERLFDDPEAMERFLGCAFLQRHGAYFIPYARHCFNSQHLNGQSLYGRFDAALNPDTGQITGIYEFNGDTPVMLFESINLQHRLLSQIEPSGQQQYNEWYGLTRDLFKAYRLGPEHQVALACSFAHIEDLATCETLAQVVGEQAAAHLLDLADIDYDHAHPNQPFVIRNTDTYLDALFVLSPWEEMVQNFPTAFMHWERWVDRVAFFEPPWRWFISHKGMLAYLTWLMETDSAFAQHYRAAPFLATYLEPSIFQAAGQGYVRKPALGRLSANIEVFNATGVSISQSMGQYADSPMVYQAYHPPFQLAGRGNFIAGMWMAGRAKTRQAWPATLCFREFDTPILDLSNERFIPHRLRF